MPTDSMGRVNIWRIFSPAVCPAMAAVPKLLMAPCMMTAPRPDTEYSNPMGRPMRHSLAAWGRETPRRPPQSRKRSVLYTIQSRFSTPLTPWLSTVASAAPATPMPKGAMNR